MELQYILISETFQKFLLILFFIHLYLQSPGKKKKQPNLFRRNLTGIIKVYRQRKPEFKLNFRCCQEKKKNSTILTALQELMKPANMIRKSQNIIQRNEIVRAEVPNKPVFQRYRSRKWIKDPIFYYNMFILLIEERKLLYTSCIYNKFYHLWVQ